MVAGTHSGVGKTTVATGLMSALARRDVAVASAKVGPDFIDPGYHALATGRPPRNLDAWICGASAVAPLAARLAASPYFCFTASSIFGSLIALPIYFEICTTNSAGRP